MKKLPFHDLKRMYLYGLEREGFDFYCNNGNELLAIWVDKWNGLYISTQKYEDWVKGRE